MVVRIHDLDSWKKLEQAKGKQVLSLPGHGKRKVVVTLNCAAETRVDLVELDRNDARSTFLWAGRGMEEIEFYANGFVQLVCVSAEDVWFTTNERSGIAVPNEDEKVFTKIANRRARNPELDAIMLRAEINMNRRLARLEQEMERKYGGAGKRIDMNTGEITDEPTQEPVDDTAGTATADSEPESPAPAAE